MEKKTQEFSKLMKKEEIRQLASAFGRNLSEQQINMIAVSMEKAAAQAGKAKNKKKYKNIYMTIDSREKACNVLGISTTGKSEAERKAAEEKFKEIGEAKDYLTNNASAKTKVKNAFDYNNVKPEEVEEDILKTKKELEDFTSEIVPQVIILLTPRGGADSGYNSSSEEKKTYHDSPITCDYCKYTVKVDDPRHEINREEHEKFMQKISEEIQKIAEEGEKNRKRHTERMSKTDQDTNE
ncbi:14120_t:CDS:2 [Funneliformis geosporum]|nr:14120_t:CDS:2 [Funneliformis geosporum]